MVEHGDLPPGWRVARLGEVCKKTLLANPGRQPDQEFTYIDVSSVSNETYQIVETKQILGVDAPSRARKLVQTDDVIFATVRPTLKRIAMITAEINGQICSTGYCVLRANAEFLDPGYLYFYLLTTEVNQRVESLQKGATYPAINDSDLFALPIPLPSLVEQRAIARTLRAVQEAREARRRESALERERKAALMQQLFTHGTRGEPRKVTEIGEMPENWQVVRLGQVVNFMSGGTPSKERSDWWVGAIPWASPKDLKRPRLWDVQDHISEDGLQNGSRLAPKGAIFVVVRGMILAKDIPVALAEVPMAFNQDIKAMIPSADLCAEYLLYVLQSYKDNFVRIIGSSAHGTRRVETSGLEAFLLPLAPLREQAMMADVLHACDDKIDALEREGAALEEAFRALLEELMTGRAPVTVLGEDYVLLPRSSH